MPRTRWTLLSVPFCLLVLPLYSEDKKDGPGDRTKVTIKGRVLDSDLKPIEGVEVGVYVAGRKDSVVGTKTQEKSGAYILTTMLSGAFDLCFTHSEYRPRVLVQLCHREFSVNVSVVLYRKGERIPATAAHSYLQSVDRIAVLALALQKDQRREFIQQFTNEKDLYFGTEAKLLLSDSTSLELQQEIDTEREAVLMRLRRILPR